MARKQFKNGSLTGLVLQPGAIVSDEQDGSLKGHAVWKGDTSDYANRVRRGTPHPKDENCFCFAVQTTFLKNGQLQVDADYIGIDQDPTPYFLEFVGSVGEEAIETHENFTSIIGGTPAAPLHNAQFDATTGEFLGFPTDAPENLGGVRSYYRPSVIVRLSYWMRELPNPGPLGHIVEASAIPGLVLPPNCFNLLVTNFGYRQVTPSAPPYQVTVELLASGPNGWNPLIYYYA